MARESEREVLERIEATRRRMGRTVEEIGDRVHPDRVQHELKVRARGQVDELKHNVKRKARHTMDEVEHEMRETGRGVWDTIRENPIPAGMVGVGLAWLVTNGARDDDSGYRSRTLRREPYPYGRDRDVPNRYRPVAGTAYGQDVDERYDMDGADEDGRMAEAADRVRERGEEAMESVRERGEEAMDSAREKGHEMASSARERGRELKHDVREGMHEATYRARRAERRVEHAVGENPLVAGAMAAALGLAAGLLLPETDRERELMGDARERVKERAEEGARRAASKARDMARETASRSAHRAVDEVLAEDDSSESRGAGSRSSTGMNAMREPGR